MRASLKLCGKCRHHDPSRLADYGYCLAGPTPVDRARLMPARGGCRLDPAQFEPRESHESRPSPEEVSQ